ncbi:hypothetical protein [Lacrimispora sp.]|jgi:hypothetical protein|uniref:hypothetical protein n=1 Tax=Lacrimispora sp. TaxID=2719234 RepID=UPI0028A7B972|nr:hypothetical protein [Lacrimispora sp.]
MQKLSIQEQREIIGGGWGFKAYDENGNLAYFNFSFSTSADAASERASIMRSHPRWNVFDVELR